MARIRTIKPEFFTSSDIVGLTPLSRLFYVSLWCEADREGRLKWDERTLKMRYLPADDCDVSEIAGELVDSGLVVIYEVEGKLYAEIPTFKQHQVINNRESESVLPSRVKDASARVKAEGKEGREGKGKEGKEISIVEQQADATKSKRNCKIPADFDLTDDRINSAVTYWKTKNRPDLDPAGEFQKFINHFTANGKRMADWDACWRTWYTNAITFNKPAFGVMDYENPRTAAEHRLAVSRHTTNYELATDF